MVFERSLTIQVYNNPNDSLINLHLIQHLFRFKSNTDHYCIGWQVFDLLFLFNLFLTKIQADFVGRRLDKFQS